MEDDINPAHGISSRARARLSTDIDSLLKHLAPREDAKRWAKNPRFLTFDDGDGSMTDAAQAPSSDVGSSQQCRRCAERIPVPAGHVCAMHANLQMTSEQLEAREDDLKSYANPCVHVRELTCDGCRHIPLFPNRGTVSTFKIRRRTLWAGEREPINCQHYVAVSYCWSSQGGYDSSDGTSCEPYTVIEEDGSRRTMRTAKETVDRAVAFARENGFRMIWIDQECIEQDKDYEKEMGVNSMDLIYQNAHTCIGLLNTSWERRHWNVILEECEHVMGRPDRPRRGTSPEVERSNSRFRQTYIEAMAEAVLGLLTDRWNTRAWILQEAFVSADRMLLLFPRNGMNTDGWYLVCNEKCITEVAINLDLIQQGLEASIFPLLAPTDDARSNRVFFDMVRYFYPRSMDTYGRVGVGNFYIRRRCDAATALAYLNRRSLARVADRIAILANLCGYEQRLNTFELEKGQQSLSVSMLALSLANGDLTLLVPEMYRTPAGVLPEFLSEFEADTDFSWVHAYTKNLHLLDSTTLLPSSNTTISEDSRMYELSSSGLSLFGTLWEIAEFIDLEPIRQKYADDWRDAKQAGTSNEARRQATAHILFETMMLLKAKDMIQAADAIFNSVSDPLWRSRDRLTGSDVVESLSHIPSIPATECEDMFVFSWVIGGMPHQSWLIDRIMHTGGMWLAKPVDCYQLPFGADVDAVSAWKVNSSATTVSRSLDLYSRCAEGASMQTWVRHIFEASSHLAEESHCGRLFQTGLFAKLVTKWLDESLEPFAPVVKIEQFSGVSLDGNDKAGPLGKRSALDAMLSSVVPLAQWSKLLTGQVDRSEFLNRRAVFDIEGDGMTGTLILTPFQAQLESVPRARARNLSVSWVVKSLDNEDTGEHKETHKRFKATRMVRGMWKYTFLNSGRFTLV